MRRYLVAPSGAVLLDVRASSPHVALRRAAAGHAEPVEVEKGLVFPASRVTRQKNGDAEPIPGQLDLYGQEEGT